MNIRITFLLSLFLVVGLQAQVPDSVLYKKARKIHEKVITIDTHNDINVDNFTKSKNYTQRLDTQVNLPKMSEGGVDVTWLIVYTGQEELNAAGYKLSLIHI